MKKFSCISSMIVMAAARGILLKCNQRMLAECGGHIELNRFLSLKTGIIVIIFLNNNYL